MSNASNPLAINYKNLGVAKHKEGKYKDACEDYLRSIEIDTNDSETHYFMGLSLSELEKYNEAIERFNNAIKIDDGKTTIYYFNLALTKFKSKDLEGAEEDYSKFIENDLKLSESNYLYLRAYFERGNIRRMRNDVIRAILDWSYVIEHVKRFDPDERDIHLYYQVSDKLGRERISDLKTHEELCKLSTLNKINLFENPDIYKEWMESDYMPEVLKKGFKRNGQRFKN